MNRINIYTLLNILLTAVILTSCATAPKTVETQKPEEIKPRVEKKKEYIPTEQETKSLDLFTEILDVIETSGDRRSALPKIEELYKRIIREYPDAPLAQESYWKLITIYVKDYSPPDYAQAESLYHEFLEKYPESILKGMVQDTLGTSYYKNKKWNKLLELCTPTYTEYIEQKKRPRASLLFMYSEANYNLGNVSEAVKGYEIILELFPRVREGIKSKMILDKINKKKD